MQKLELLDGAGLEAAGCGKSPSQHNRNIKDGKFPAPIKIGARNAWLAEEIEAFKRAEIAKRDYPFLKDDLTAWIRKQIRTGNNPWRDGRIDAWVSARLKDREATKS